MTVAKKAPSPDLIDQHLAGRQAVTRNKVQLSVESDGSKQLEADLPASFTETLFSKPPQSGKAEQQTKMMITLDVACVSGAVIGKGLVSGNGK